MAFSSNAQQPGFCGTLASSDAPTTIDLRSAGEVQGPLYIRLYISIVRDDNGDGGQPPERAQQAFDILQKDFAPYGIFFVWDCNINYVDDSYHYEGVYGISYNDILYDADYLHDDGIDLFLFQDVTNNGVGKAEDIVSKACYVFGNSHLSPGPNTPFGETSVISHEVGHCLGLWHTFEAINGPELVNGVNCQSTGDFVCDTPADVNDGFTVGHPSCEWNGNDVDANGDLYDPDETNIMSYSHPLCYKGFSDAGQGERMRFLIATEPALQDCIVGPDANLYTITSNTTWSITNTPNNGDFFVGGNVTITNGATLTIESDVTVRFGEESRLVIESGSKLNLYGKLTGLGCNGNTWKGILVSGDTNLPQAQANQGYLQCHPGAQIENAEIGIHVVDNLSVAEGGGMVNCRDMTIKNCETGVKLTRYKYSGNSVADFTRITFLNDNDYPANASFYAFADLEYVGGVMFRGCSFINGQSDGDYDDQNLNIENWGYGIRANRSGFSVRVACDNIFCNSFEESLFKGLGYGIYAFTGTPSSGDDEQPYPYEVSKATFEKCLVGIRNSFVEGSKIIYNTFVLGGSPEGMPEFSEVDQVGVYYENDVLGFICEENEFIGTGSAANIFTIGTIVKSTGMLNKTIRKSTYQDLAIGNLANGQNAGIPGGGFDIDRGMYYDCNQHDAVTFSDYMVEDGGAIRLDQSQKTETEQDVFEELATGNLFSQTGDPAFDFLNEGLFTLRYFYDQSEIRAVPFERFGVFTQSPDEPSFSCPTEFCEPPQICTEGPTKEEHKEGFFDSEGAFEDLLASYASQPDSNTLKGLQYHQQEMDKHAYAVIRSQLQDTLQFNIDSLRTWVRHLNSLEGDLWLVRSYVGDHDLTAAGQLLNQIPTKYNLPSHLQQDMQDYALLANMLYNKSLDSLGEPTLQQLEAYTDSGYYSEAWAKNILAGHGWHFPPDYTRDYTPPQALIDIGDTGTPSADKAVSLLRVQPNPASDQVRFDYQVPENTEQLQLRVIDVTGRAVWRQAAHSTVGSLQWQIGATPRGLYLYQLWANGKLLESGKLFIK